MKKIYKYEFSYLSEAFRDYKEGDSFRTKILLSTEPLEYLDTIVICKKSRGLFLGRIEKDLSAEIDINEQCEYEFVQHIDLSNFFRNKEKEEQKKKLRKAMEAKFEQLDKEKKFAYYATLDEDFKVLYDEYKNL